MSFSRLTEDIFKELNFLRTRPQDFASRMEDWESSYRENNARMRKGAVPVMTREGVSALLETIQAIRSTKPMPALALSDGMCRAAQSHCHDTGPLGIVGHIGSKETTLQDRVETFGRWSECIGETIDYGSLTGFESVCALLVDDGLPSRPHRNIVLNPRFRKVGVGAGKHSQYQTMACCVFAGEFNEKEEMPAVPGAVGNIEKHSELKDWLEDAVKLTCEVRTEEEAGRVVKRVKKYWEMADGTTQISEEVINDHADD
jgi:uncharacterized protein YkwD